MSQMDAASLREQFWRLPPEALVNRATAAAVIFVSKATMEALAIKGGGPPYSRVGRGALYRKATLLRWVEESGRTVRNTAQLGQKP